MRCAGAAPYGLRAGALVVLLWRAGLRVSEALALAESDLDCSTGGVLVRLGKGGKRRRVGMDRWGWQQLHGEKHHLDAGGRRWQTLRLVAFRTVL